MEVEQLKRLVERLGYYKVELVGDALGVIGIFVTKEKFGMKYKFNPETNAEQLLEVMSLFEWLGIERPMKETVVLDFRVDLQDDLLRTVIGKTLAEAVLKAAIELEGK